MSKIEICIIVCNNWGSYLASHIQFDCSKYSVCLIRYDEVSFPQKNEKGIIINVKVVLNCKSCFKNVTDH